MRGGGAPAVQQAEVFRSSLVVSTCAAQRSRHSTAQQTRRGREAGGKRQGAGQHEGLQQRLGSRRGQPPPHIVSSEEVLGSPAPGHPPYLAIIALHRIQHQLLVLPQLPGTHQLLDARAGSSPAADRQAGRQGRVAAAAAAAAVPCWQFHTPLAPRQRPGLDPDHYRVTLTPQQQRQRD